MPAGAGSRGQRKSRSCRPVQPKSEQVKARKCRPEERLRRWAADSQGGILPGPTGRPDSMPWSQWNGVGAQGCSSAGQPSRSGEAGIPVCGWSCPQGSLRLLESYLQGLRPDPPNSVVTRVPSIESRKGSGQCGTLRHILAAPSPTGLLGLMERDAGCQVGRCGPYT